MDHNAVLYKKRKLAIEYGQNLLGKQSLIKCRKNERIIIKWVLKKFNWLLIGRMDRDKSASIETSYGLEGLGSIPARGKRCLSTSQRTDRLWDSPILLPNGYRG